MITQQPHIHISKLHLQRNSLGDQGAIMIVKALKVSYTIVSLNLASNSISPLGMREVFNELADHQSLTALNMSTEDGINRNRLNQTSIEALCRLVSKNKFLNFLELKGVGLTKMYMCELFDSMRQPYLSQKSVYLADMKQ